MSKISWLHLSDGNCDDKFGHKMVKNQISNWNNKRFVLFIIKPWFFKQSII